MVFESFLTCEFLDVIEELIPGDASERIADSRGRSAWGCIWEGHRMESILSLNICIQIDSLRRAPRCPSRFATPLLSVRSIFGRRPHWSRIRQLCPLLVHVEN